ncbi:hypothetical protein BT69DRAFT_1290976 [Atractiella rhizophila]|nr:hypothetical protein BT69DRAFT_1290976 [Atractiella rhizophila]
MKATGETQAANSQRSMIVNFNLVLCAITDVRSPYVSEIKGHLSVYSTEEDHYAC